MDLPQTVPPPAWTVLTNAVSKKDIQAGKSKNFDDKDEQWQNIVFGGLFGTGQDDIQLSAEVAKNGQKLTVTLGYRIR
jgi:hypothetical protein